MNINATPMRQKLWTPWFTFGVVLIVIGAAVAIYRFVYGIGAVTNLSDGYPWGLWIVFDVVTGIALAAGGFTMAALVYIFNRGKYSPLVRPALLTALLGYALASLAIILDVGRWWQVYNPALPANWQGNSPLFEVSLCVMSYLTVLFLEFVPVPSERWKRSDNAFLQGIADKVATAVNKFLIFLIILGVVISTLHQSSLGAVMLIAFDRIHPLWHSPFLPLFFLLSAIAIGLPMVIFESVLSARTFHRRVESNLLASLARIVPWILGIYLLTRIIDIIYYGEVALLFSGWGLLFIVENLMLAILPMLLFLKPSVRRSTDGRFWTSVLMIFGLILNRFNTYLLTYEPRPGWDYFPSLGEFAVTAMIVAAMFVGYKILANAFPVLPEERVTV